MKTPLTVIVATLSLTVGILGTAWAYAPKKAAMSPTAKTIPDGALPRVSPLKFSKQHRGFTGSYYGWLGSIETDAAGTITTLSVLTNEGTVAKPVDGCGAKIADLVHVPWAHLISTSDTAQYGLWLNVDVKDGCLDRIRVERHRWYRSGN